MEKFTRLVIALIKSIPAGKVSTYGQLSLMAGKSTGARQVARIIHALSRKYNLPWHRVINAKGLISLPKLGGYEEQKTRLQLEGVKFDKKDKVDLKNYLWTGEANL